MIAQCPQPYTKYSGLVSGPDCPLYTAITLMINGSSQELQWELTSETPAAPVLKSCVPKGGIPERAAPT